MVLEQNMTGTVIGEMLGIRGNGRRVTFGILHVFAFTTASSVASRSGSTVGPSSPSSPPPGFAPGQSRHREEPGRFRIATPDSRR